MDAQTSYIGQECLVATALDLSFRAGPSHPDTSFYTALLD